MTVRLNEDVATLADRLDRRTDETAGPPGARPPGAGPQRDAGVSGVSAFLQLEREARHAETVEALDFIAANETRRLIPYRQAAVLAPRSGRRWRLQAVSGVSTLDRDAPYVRWLQRVAAHLAVPSGPATASRPLTVSPADLSPKLAAQWDEWGTARALWCPLVAPSGTVVGGLWLTRDDGFGETEIVLLERLADAYAHARRALDRGPERLKARRLRARVLAGIALALAAVVLALPVRQSALAPAEVVAADPLVVTAPIDGVIAEMAVEPNTAVAAGDLLVRFDDTELRSARDVAERTLGVAEAELRRARQGAFGDAESAAQLAVLEARRDLRAAELAFAEARLARVAVRAPRSGVAVYADADDWIGRPVATGERIMTLAEPGEARLRIDLAVGDSIVLAEGAPVQMFLDAAPLSPIEARVTSAAYEAEPTAAGTLAYRVDADFGDAAPPPRIGLRGTAKVRGDRVPLAFYLLRRPISWLRQATGL